MFPPHLFCVVCVVAFSAQDVTHSTSGIFDVPSVSGDEMHMKVRNTLSCNYALVDTDVIAIWVKSAIEDFFGACEKLEKIMELRLVNFKDGCYMFLDDNLRMSRTDRKVIESCKKRIVYRKDIAIFNYVDIAEKTVHRML